ncbi:energy transducer TonB [Pontibacter ruber]|uniref:TonB family protein n=1 Tax=Pontibacter ruber TaxID=1343895 RepID=A0ABW5CWB7_9BACT|nr:energy transducer TonB [Pontibacter ruber]
MKHYYTYLLLACMLLVEHIASAQTARIKYFSKSGVKEVPEAQAYFYEVEEENEAGGGTRTRFLAEDSTKVHQYTYSDLDGGKYGLGTVDGPFFEWYKSGKLKQQMDYKGNDLQEYKHWYENGQLHYRRKYNSGLTKDTLTAYYESGRVRRLEVYEKNKLISGKLFDEAGKELKFFPMEQMPEFPGGESIMLRWLAMNIKYPKAVRKAEAQGLVVISFVVSKDGNVEDAEVIKGFHPDAEAEGLRVVNKMPKWKPGLQEGEPVPVRYTLPLKFSFK